MNNLLSEEQFETLYNYLASEERLGPGPNQGSAACDHTLRDTIEWMKAHEVQDIPANAERLIDLGGHCDCEVLLNVNPETWAAFKEDALNGPDFMGEAEWEQFVSGLLYASGYSESEGE
jgi:hypothetical protein